MNEKQLIQPFDCVNNLLFKEKTKKIMMPWDLIFRELVHYSEDNDHYKNAVNQLLGACKKYYQQDFEGIYKELNNTELIYLPEEDIDKINERIEDVSLEIYSYRENISFEKKDFESLQSLADKINSIEKGYCQISNELLEDESVKPSDIEAKIPLEEDVLIDRIMKCMDGVYLASLMANQFFRIFTYICLSILKAEYLFEDKLSKEKIVPLLDALQQKQKDDSNKEPFILYDNKIDCYLDDLSYFCKQYYSFNRRIDHAIDENMNAVLPMVIDENVADELTLFQVGYNTILYQGHVPNILLSIGSRFRYLFRYILEMTYIDHNFAVGEKELNSLLLLRTFLAKIYNIVPDKKLQQQLHNMKGSWKAKMEKELFFIDDEVTQKFLDVLKLVELKNDYLIYKIFISDKSGRLKNYTYIAEGKVITFKEIERNHKLGNSFYLSGQKLMERYSVSENVVWKQSKIYNEMLLKKRSSEVPFLFMEYEEVFLDLIGKKRALVDCQDNFKKMGKCFQDEKCKLDNPDHKDISLYNWKIASHVEDQFIKYGMFVKKLSWGIGEKEIESYVDELGEFLDREEGKAIYSCSFVIKHFEWVLEQLEKICVTAQYDKLGFKLQVLVEKIQNVFADLLKSIERNSYCINFASLYQDSFYCFEWDNPKKENIDWQFNKVSRIPIETIKDIREKVFSTKGRSEVVFIASTWLQPVGKIALEDKYKELIQRKTKLIADFYSLYFLYENEELEKRKKELDEEKKTVEQKIESVQEDVKREIEENKRVTVQTLGIFAAFLALATVSVRGLAEFSTPENFFKVIGGITGCLAIFVVLLKFVISSFPKYGKKKDPHK